MTEISAQVDLAHPADRVWRALTQRELLVRWFAEVGADAGTRDRLLLHTTGLPGFDVAVDAEVVEHREPESLVLSCDEAGRLSQLTCTLTRTVEGCRLSVTETLEHGRWSAEQRADRERYYQHAVSGRLPAILDWVAFREVDLRRAEGPPTAELPVATLLGDPVRGRRRRSVWLAALVGLALVAVAAVWAVLPTRPRPVAAPGPVPAPPSSATASSPPPRPAASSA
ncbi:SRPBCC domain-containing protein, partial [Micromonospora sp. KC723]|uniref:SRPBCC family protein n=1 Tax=Micromonospora sp. KC723 TaxID=2530381 RepID=UPI001046F1A6